ncbi:MAG TPA: glycosyltransferase [Candidatus Paceibacterota bacterium]|nr:glycosyltransferase [Candidatus Paceibacterota bacterium]
MRLLVLAQTLDKKDPTLGFFHEWVVALAARTDSLLVFVLKTGEYTLPKNVLVEPLRTSKQRTPFCTAIRVLSLSWKHRNSYNAVFVHMNQEYILVAGILWKLLGKRVYLWRNHYAGSFLTTLAALFCDKIFYTSTSSYTAKYKQAVQMPVGVDVDSSHFERTLDRMPDSVLFFGRFNQSKRPDVLVEALGILKERGVRFVATFAGGQDDPTSTYFEDVKGRAAELGLLNQVMFTGTAIPAPERYSYFRSHMVYVNAGKSGMLDKTIFEAIAASCIPLTASKDMAEIAGPEFSYPYGDAPALAERIKTVLAFPAEKRAATVRILQEKTASHTLPVLVDKLIAEMA